MNFAGKFLRRRKIFRKVLNLSNIYNEKRRKISVSEHTKIKSLADDIVNIICGMGNFKASIWAINRVLNIFL